MPRKKNRGYKQGEPFRDSRLIVIATEGAKREKEYFELLVYGNQKVKIKILAPVDEEEGKSAPKWVMDRALNYVETFGLSKDDQLWLVIDVDKWALSQVHEIAKECSNIKNWNIAISNPCFEVWLLLHYKELVKANQRTCSHLKTELGNIVSGGYNLNFAIAQINIAIQRAKDSDSNKGHYFPNPMETKIYLLAEELTTML